MKNTEDGTLTVTDNLTRLWEQLTGTQRETLIDFDDLFSPSFMREHTQYESFNEFVSESHWEIETETDLDAIPLTEFDRYVAETTQFSSWNGMATTAAETDLLERYSGVSLDMDEPDQ